MRRYIINTLARILTVYLLFAMTFFGGRSVAPQVIGDSIEAIIVGYFLWTMAVGAYSSVASDISTEAQWGTLEQVYMSPFGFGQVLMAKVFVNLVVSVLFGLIVLLMMLATVDVTLRIDIFTIAPVVLLSLLPVIGIGFIFGGLAIVYKRVENVFSIVRFVFIALVAVPIDQFPLMKFAPLSLGSYLIRRSAEAGVGLWSFPTDLLVILLIQSVVYFGSGFLVYHWLQDLARRRGVLGHY